MNDKFVDEYDYENVQRKLVNSVRIEGYDNGYENGYDSGIKDVIKKMLKENATVKFITKVTGLSAKQINDLRD